MELLDRILDLPVIIQGALGSFVFWIAYVVSQKAINTAAQVIGKFSKSVKRENILFEQSHLLQDVIPLNDVAGIRVHILSVQASLHKFTQGAIFLCFGFIANELIGWISVVAYVIALYYFFRALKAGYVTFVSSGESIDDKKKRLKVLDKEKKQLDEKSQA